MKNLDPVREQLKRLSSEDRAALLYHLEKKDKENNFVKYWKPTPKQLPHFQEFSEEIKIFGILGGNRSGKTEEGSVIATAWCLGKEFFRDSPAWEFIQHLPIPEPPNNVWLVGLDFNVLRDVIWREKLRYGRQHPGLIPKDDAVVRKVSDTDFQVFFTNGSIMTGKSAEGGREKFQGASVDLVWIDEEPEVEIFDECYQRTVDCKGKLLLTLTPLTDIASGVRTPWVYDLHEEFQTGKKDVKFVQLSVLDNPYVPEEEKTKLLEKWSGHPEEKARLYGEFVQRSGLVYPMWDKDKHLVDPFRIPRDWQRIVSIDPAATGVTAAIWGAVNETGDIYLYREYYERDQVVSSHAKSIILRNSGDPVDVWLIDPKWGTQRNAENHKQNMQLYRESGIPVRLASVGADFGLNTSLEYMNATVTPGARHPKVYVFKTLTTYRWEIEHYTWANFSKGENKGLSKEKPNKRNDHLMNAWQYLSAMRPRGKGRPNLNPEKLLELARLNSYT